MNGIARPNLHYLILPEKSLVKFSFKSSGTNFEVASAFLSDLSMAFQLVSTRHRSQQWGFMVEIRVGEGAFPYSLILFFYQSILIIALATQSPDAEA